MAEVPEGWELVDEATSAADEAVIPEGWELAPETETPLPEKEAREQHENNIEQWLLGTGESLGKGALFGAMDEVQGGVRTLVDMFQADPTEDMDDIVQRESDRLGDFEMFRKDSSDHQRAFAEDNPFTAGIAELGGALMTGTASLKALNKAAPAMNAVAKGSATAGADMALYGFMDEEGGLADRSMAGLQWGLGGAAFGGALGLGAKAITSSRTKKAIAEANDTLNSLQDDLIIARSRGATQEEAQDAAMRYNAIDGEGYAAAQMLASGDGEVRKLMMPEMATALELAPEILRKRAEGFKDPATRLKKIYSAIGNNSVVQGASAVLENLGGVASTTLRKASPAAFGRVRAFESNVRQMQQKALKPLHKLHTLGSAIPKAEYKVFAKAVFNGDRATARDIVANSAPKQREALEAAFEQLDFYGKEMEKLGLITKEQLKDGYWARKVRDPKGLRSVLGRENPDMYAMETFVEKRKKQMGKRWTPNEEKKARADWTNRNKFEGDGTPGHRKTRTVEQVTDEMLPFYDDPISSLTQYIHQASEDIQMVKMFDAGNKGKSLRDTLINRMKNEASGMDTDAINRVLDKELGDSLGDVITQFKLDPDQAYTVQKVMQARFGPGRRGGNEAMGKMRQISTISALGQFSSAITQIGDSATALYKAGGLSGVKGMMKTLLPKQLGGKNAAWRLEDIGLDQTIAADLMVENTGELAKWTDRILEVTQFKRLDKFGKETFVNGVFDKYVTGLNKASHKKRQQITEEFMETWGDVYGDHAAEVLKDLADGRKTDWTRLHMFNELSDIQPISQIEMPLAYLNNPNARILYTLKSFMIKQLDIMRRDVFDNAAKGTVEGTSKAVANLLRYGITVGLLNGTVKEVKDLMGGKEFRPEDIPDNMAEFGLGMVFLGDYSRNQLSEGDKGFKEWVFGILSPAVPAYSFDEPEKFAKNIPVVGKNVYDHYLGGAEKARKWERKQDRERENAKYR